jgi:hypothetical protein
VVAPRPSVVEAERWAPGVADPAVGVTPPPVDVARGGFRGRVGLLSPSGSTLIGPGG